MTDVVTFGETMFRLTPYDDEPLGMADGFDIRVGGAESNVAVAAKRLGADALWTSKLPDTGVGQKVVNELHEYDIETDVVWSEDGRLGTYYLEEGGKPRGTNVIYDRANAAVTTATATELPVEHVQNASVFYTSGITPALSDTLYETVDDLLSIAQEADTTTAFDLNYRSKLWSPAEAREALTGLFPAIDVLVVAERDATNVLDIEGTAREQAEALASEYGFETVIITQGERGSLALSDGQVYEQGVFESDTVDAIGTGDAFVGAFLARRLSGDDVPAALEYGAAAAAVKRTLPGDMLSASGSAVERVVEEDTEAISR